MTSFSTACEYTILKEDHHKKNYNNSYKEKGNTLTMDDIEINMIIRSFIFQNCKVDQKIENNKNSRNNNKDENISFEIFDVCKYCTCEDNLSLGNF